MQEQSLSTGLWMIPLGYLTMALAGVLGHGGRRAWTVAEALALCVLAGLVPVAGVAAWRGWVALGALQWAMTALLALLGWVIVRYARRYLDGEPGQPRFLAALGATLAAIAVVAITPNLGVLVVAWAVSSLTLHQLLVFYPERPAALLAAHEKFLASRLAEACLLAALALVYATVGSLNIAALGAWAQQHAGLSPALRAALALVAVAAILKSAQLPVHGWILQVMEAPTPVSALLHAGLVNLGGFVLLRLAVPLADAPLARALLVTVGAGTALLAGLAVMTQISIKVRLAWSTCTQMGFMLAECGLGLYELAFLHLIAHSLYKAHAFLSAGTSVGKGCGEVGRIAPSAPAVNPVARLACVPVALGVVVAVAWLVPVMVAVAPVAPAPLVIVALGLAPLLWPGVNAQRVLSVAALAGLYVLWHALFGRLFGAVALVPAAPGLAVLFVAALTALYVVQTWVLSRPQGALARALYPAAAAGFHLDAWLTRVTLVLWPPRLPECRAFGSGPTAAPAPAPAIGGRP